jgi:hypothetical protein
VIVEWFDKVCGKISGEIRHILFVKQMKHLQKLDYWPSIFDFGVLTRTKTTEDLWPSSASSSDMGILDSSDSSNSFTDSDSSTSSDSDS